MKLDLSPSRKRCTQAGFIALVLWGTAVAVGRSLTEKVGGITAIAFIQLIGGTLGCAYLLYTRRLISNLKKLSSSYLLWCGVLFAAYMFFFYSALGSAVNRVQVLEVGLVNYLWPTLTLLLSVPILGNKASPLLAACSFFTPVLSTILGSVYLRVIPSIEIWIACALVVAGAIISKKSIVEAEAT